LQLTYVVMQCASGSVKRSNKYGYDIISTQLSESVQM